MRNKILEVFPTATFSKVDGILLITVNDAEVGVTDEMELVYNMLDGKVSKFGEPVYDDTFDSIESIVSELKSLF